MEASWPTPTGMREVAESKKNPFLPTFTVRIPPAQLFQSGFISKGRPARACRTTGVTSGLSYGVQKFADSSPRDLRQPTMNTLLRSVGAPTSQALIGSGFSTLYSFRTISSAASNMAAYFSCRIPGTFSRTKAFGLISFTNLKKSKISEFRASSTSRFPMVLKPWQGGPPARTSKAPLATPDFSSNSLPLVCPISKFRCFALGKFRECAFRARESLSTPETTLKPARAAPRLMPPQPQKRSMSFGVEPCFITLLRQLDKQTEIIHDDVKRPYCSSAPFSLGALASSGGITMAAATLSSVSRSRSLTPMVARPAARTDLVSMRMILPN